MRTFLKPFSFLPAILLMYMIFSFSAQDGQASSALSYKVSYTVVKSADHVLDAGLEEWEMQSLATRFEGVTRKLAHMAEYFALAVAVSFPLYVYGLHGFLLMLLAGFICVAFACTDEYHQSFVSGRSPAVRDVMIDSFGVFWGIVLVRIIGWTGRKTIFRPLRKKAARDEYDYDYEDTRAPVRRKKAKSGRYRRPDEAYDRYEDDRRPVGSYSRQYAGRYPDEPYRGGYAEERYSGPYADRRYDRPYGGAYTGGYSDKRSDVHDSGESYDRYYDDRRSGEPYDRYYDDGRSGEPYDGYPESFRHDDYRNGGGRQTEPSYRSPVYSHHEAAETRGSDKLAEDMSFKKLIHDIREQRREDKKQQDS